jgi:hypothetical protein
MGGIIMTGPAEAKVDIYFLPDTTGSMGGYLDSVKKSASSLMEKVRTEVKGADVQFGVGNYKDFSKGDKVFVPQQSVTADLKLIVAAINDWQADGGGDIPEAQLYALDQLATTGGEGGHRLAAWCAAHRGLVRGRSWPRPDP